MAMWVFGYGSLIWKTGFHYDDRLVGFIKGYRRVFYQGSTDHRGTPDFPGRTVTLEPAEGEVCYLEVREKQYDQKAHVDIFSDRAATVPAVSGVLIYIASADQKLNRNYLGPASLQEIANQIVRAEGPSGPNRDYLFQLEKALTLLEKHMLSMDWDCLGSVFWLSWNERDWMDFQGLKKHSCIRAHCSLFYMLSLDRQTICIDSWMLFGRTSNVSRNILYMMILF
ncbi:gamma-glutamylcyclotransferase 2-3 isoform X3 [Coffea arabica]|uniref:glutathione-specific gamma-glutamylcyclotransferase n=1 Tax=Coffea arabica TaxID=13443 RepID=A0A6P6UPF9_COFAR